MGAISVEHYVLKMENAANIRTNAKQMMQQIGFAVLMGWADELHRQEIENALHQFKQLFKQWVTTFQKDHYEDEWVYLFSSQISWCARVSKLNSNMQVLIFQW